MGKQRKTLNIDHLREKELQNLERIEKYAQELIMTENSIQAIGILLKISERRCKLFNLDKPTMPLLDAVQVLLSDNVLSEKHAQIIVNHIESLYQALRIARDE